VQEACRRIIDGDTLRAITRDWNQRGLTTASGSEWRPQPIKRMLARPSTAGMIQREAGLFNGQWPALLTRAHWDAVRLVLLGEPGPGAVARHVRPVHLLRLAGDGTRRQQLL